MSRTPQARTCRPLRRRHARQRKLGRRRGRILQVGPAILDHHFDHHCALSGAAPCGSSSFRMSLELRRWTSVNGRGLAADGWGPGGRARGPSRGSRAASPSLASAVSLSTRSAAGRLRSAYNQCAASWTMPTTPYAQIVAGSRWTSGRAQPLGHDRGPGLGDLPLSGRHRVHRSVAARVDEAVQRGLLLDQPDESRDDRAQPDPPVIAPELQFVQQSGEQDPSEDSLEDGVDDLVLVSEVAVDDRLGNSCTTGDVVHRKLWTCAPDRFQRGVDELLAAGPTVLGPAGAPAVGAAAAYCPRLMLSATSLSVASRRALPCTGERALPGSWP